MALSVLTIVQRALAGPGMKAPSSLISPNDDLGPQAIALLYETAEDMISRFDWQELKADGSLTTTGVESQGSLATLYPDLDHIINGTVWNATTNTKLNGVATSQEWQRLKRQLGTTASLNGPWRVLGNTFYLLGNSTAGQNITFEYVTKKWLTTADSATPKDEITLNADLCRLPARVVVAGVRWRWQEAKGLDYSEAFRTYERFMESAAGDSIGTDVISLTPRRRKGDMVDVNVTVDGEDYWEGIDW